MDTLSNWLEKRFLDWQVKQGRRSTLDEFAEFLGFTRAYISMMLNGSRLTLSMQTAYQIGERLDDFTVLEILGYPVPDAPLIGLADTERDAILGWLESVKVALDGVPEVERMAKLNEILDGMPDADTEVE